MKKFKLVKKWVYNKTWNDAFAQAFPTLADRQPYLPDSGYLKIPSSSADSGYSCR